MCCSRLVILPEKGGSNSMGKFFFCLVAVALTTAACSASDRAASRTGSVLPVQVDGKAAGVNASFATYFPNAVTAHPGDSLRFTFIDNGALHTVTLSSRVDKALASGATLQQTLSSAEALGLP